MIDVTELLVTADDVLRYCKTQLGYGPVAKVRCLEDPKVPGTWAARMELAGGDSAGPEVVDLLFVTRAYGEAASARTADELLDLTAEEVAFTAWPPVSGALQFFI